MTSNKHEDPRVQEALDADLAVEGGKWKPERAEPTAPVVPDEEQEAGPPGPWIASDIELFGIPKGRDRREGPIKLAPDVLALDLEAIGDRPGEPMGYLVIATGIDVRRARPDDRVVIDHEEEGREPTLMASWGRQIGLCRESAVLATLTREPARREDEGAGEDDGSNRTPGTPDLEPPSGLTPAQRDAEKARKNAAAILARKVKSKHSDPEEIDELVRKSGGFPLTPEAAPGRTLSQKKRTDTR